MTTYPDTKRKGQEVAIPCLVLDQHNRPLKYDEVNKILSYAGPRDFTEFPTKRAALHARWHTVERDKKNQIFEPWNLYTVVEM